MAKILVVDDDPEMHEVLQNIFGDEFELLRASDTAEAREILREHSPEVAIIDMMLPGENGDSLVKNGHLPEAACILLTGFSTGPNFAAEMLSIGFLYVVAKPFNPVEIQALVKRAISHLNHRKVAKKSRNSSEMRYNPDAVQRLRDAVSAFKVAVG
jgi:two-component system OmpR family response regulator